MGTHQSLHDQRSPLPHVRDAVKHGKLVLVGSLVEKPVHRYEDATLADARAAAEDESGSLALPVRASRAPAPCKR